MIAPELAVRIERLTFQRRHTDQCRAELKFTGEWTQLDGRKRCSCPYWVKGVIFPEEGFQRKTSGEATLEAARAVVLHWMMQGSTATKPAEPDRTPISEAIEDFMEHMKSDREAKTSTLKKYGTLMDQLKAFTDWKGYRFIHELGPDAILEFRRSWEDESAGWKIGETLHNKPRWTKVSLHTARRQAKILKYFFDRCIQRKWIKENPTTVITFKREKAAKRKQDVKYLTAQQLTDILATIDGMPRMPDENKKRLKALVLTMRWTGLRISDAVVLKRESIVDDVLRITTKKASTPVQIPLPPELVVLLNGPPTYNGGYVFWNRRKDNASANTPRLNYITTLIPIFRKAGVKAEGDGKPLTHALRNTFAVDLLTKGVPLETVSLLLGHQSVTTTEKYYSDFSSGYMDHAEAMVRRTWTLKAGEHLAPANQAKST